MVRAISRGNPFTPGSLRALTALSWVVSFGLLAYIFTLFFGTNLASRDLGIADAVVSGISTAQNYVLIGAVGAVEVLRRSFVSGKKAQDELEGLV